jgi:predicted MFS family arabinose efflux permease
MPILQDTGNKAHPLNWLQEKPLAENTHTAEQGSADLAPRQSPVTNFFKGQTMTALAATRDNFEMPTRARWSAVFALSLGAFALVASEFMPISLLTPIASDLGVTEGQAGLSIAVSGAFAVLTSLFISSIARAINRKTLLLSLTAAMLVAGGIVAFADSYYVFMGGRILVGIAIGGFWSLSAATAMRLVPKESVPKALAIVNGGNALATVIAAPLGSFLGSIVGWRGAFFAIVPVAAAVLLWQWRSFPAMKTRAGDSGQSPATLLRSRVVVLGMAAVALFFMGQFSLFTYLRPFLETVTQVQVGALSLILLLVGVSGFAGTVTIGLFLTRSVYPSVIAIPLTMAVLALLLTAVDSDVVATAVLLMIWGLLATSAPVAWWTWIANTLPDDAEAGGGLMVAVVQLAITSGATLGGLLFDFAGYRATFATSALILIAASAFAVLTKHSARPGQNGQH